MRVAYLGAFAHSWATEAHMASDMETLGVTVDRIALPARPEPDWAHNLRERADGADLLVYQGGGLPLTAETAWRDIEAAGTPTCSYHLDLFRGLRREAQIQTDPFWRTGTVFTADGDPNTTEHLATLGINHKWLPAAVVSDETNRGTWQARYDYDIVFVGSVGYHAEWPWRRTLLEFLHRQYGSNFRVFDHHPPTRGQDLNDLYATARIVVGDTLCLPGHRRFWSDRYYETVGRGGFLIAPYVPGITAHFTDSQHLRYYTIGDTERLGSLIDYYLEHPDEARNIAAIGNAHVKTWHTYRNRAQQMFAHLDLTVPA